MNYFNMIAISCYLINLPSYAIGVNGNHDTPKYQYVNESINVIEQENKEMLLKDEKVAPFYNDCKEEHENDNEQISNCLFLKLKKVGLLEDVSKKYFLKENKKVKEKYPETKDDEKLGIQYIGNNITQQISLGQKSLQKYLGEELQRSLYGMTFDEMKDPKNSTKLKDVKVVDHKVFTSLFKSQLSKHILTTLSSYCIEADENILLKENEEERKIQRKKNLKLLNPDEVTKNEKQAHQLWMNCVSNVQNVCNKTGVFKNINDDDKDYIYSKKRACIVTTYLKNIRENLLLLEPIEEGFKKNGKTAGISKKDSNLKFYQYGNQENEKTIDEMTNITSGDIKRGFDEGNKKAIKELEEQCLEKQKDEICQKYLNDKTKQDQLKNAIITEGVKAERMERKISSLSTDGLRKLLKDEGRDDKEIEELLKKDPDALLKQIREQFKQEKMALMKSLHESIDNNSTKGDTFNFNDDKKTLKKIKEDLKKKATKYKQLVHYNNIVSGYLKMETKTEDGENIKEGSQSQNTKLLFQELSDNAYTDNSDNRTPADITASDKDDPYETEQNIRVKNLIKAIENSDIKKTAEDNKNGNGQENGEAYIEVETINDKILKHEIENTSPEEGPTN